MARPHTSKLPEDGKLIIRNENGHVWVYRLNVELLGEIEQTYLGGRYIYTVAGKAFTNSAAAAEKLAESKPVCPCDDCVIGRANAADL